MQNANCDTSEADREVSPPACDTADGQASDSNQTEAESDWSGLNLLRDGEGRLRACTENGTLLLQYVPEWAGVIGYNEFTDGTFLLKQAPPPVTAHAGDEIQDHFDTEVLRWFERNHLMVSAEVVRRAVDSVSRSNSYHPVRDYLRGLAPWDGTPRLERWLFDFCGVEDGDQSIDAYVSAVGAKFLISAVARVMKPGSKCDSMLVLEGDQGIGKSSVARILAGDEWYADQLPEMGTKDASLALRGVWVLELSELDALNKSNTAQVKAFLSQQTERFRPPYGRRTIVVPRQCVFLGTTNADSWLRDETGGRRFWPVRCHKIDLAGLRRDRDQLWAEALHRYHSGEVWWLDDPEVINAAAEQQKMRFSADPWLESIAKWVKSPKSGFQIAHPGQVDFTSTEESVTIDDILIHCLDKPRKQCTQRDKNRVAACLKILGYERHKGGSKGERQWRYRKGVPVLIAGVPVLASVSHS